MFFNTMFNTSLVAKNKIFTELSKVFCFGTGGCFIPKNFICAHKIFTFTSAHFFRQVLHIFWQVLHIWSLLRRTVIGQIAKHFKVLFKPFCFCWKKVDLHWCLIFIPLPLNLPFCEKPIPCDSFQSNIFYYKEW